MQKRTGCDVIAALIVPAIKEFAQKMAPVLVVINRLSDFIYIEMENEEALQIPEREARERVYGKLWD